HTNAEASMRVSDECRMIDDSAIVLSESTLNDRETLLRTLILSELTNGLITPDPSHELKPNFSTALGMTREITFSSAVIPGTESSALVTDTTRNGSTVP